MCNKNVTTRKIQVHGPFKKEEEEEEEEETKNLVRSFVSFSFKKNKRTTIPLPLKCLILEKSNHINLFAVKLEPKKKFPSKNELQL